MSSFLSPRYNTIGCLLELLRTEVIPRGSNAVLTDTPKTPHLNFFALCGDSDKASNKCPLGVRAMNARTPTLQIVIIVLQSRC